MGLTWSLTTVTMWPSRITMGPAKYHITAAYSNPHVAANNLDRKLGMAFSWCKFGQKLETVNVKNCTHLTSNLAPLLQRPSFMTSTTISSSQYFLSDERFANSNASVRPLFVEFPSYWLVLIVIWSSVFISLNSYLSPKQYHRYL